MFVGIDIFTNNRYESTISTGKMTPAPIVTKIEYSVVAVDDEIVSLLTPENEIKEDVNLPSEAHLADVRKRIVEISETGERECLVVV